MDLSLLDVLPPSPLFDERVDDVLSANAPFILDPFTATPPLGDDCAMAPPRTHLLLDPFDSPPMPLAASAAPLSPSACAHPFIAAADAAAMCAPMPTSPSLQQENLPANTGAAPLLRPLAASPSAAHAAAAAHGGAAAAAGAAAAGALGACNGNAPAPAPPPAPSLAGAAAAAVSAEQRCKDKLAQRKLRNKESARRYREKQVARRRQLENYTRALSEQNRELEILHHKLLTLTCQRSMRSAAAVGDLAARVL